MLSFLKDRKASSLTGAFRFSMTADMSIEQMKQADFKDKTLAAWTAKAEESLKGKPIDSISSITYENIRLKPLYSKEDFVSEQASAIPGKPDFRRGIHQPGTVQNGWEIAQNLSYENLEELAGKLENAVQRGQTAVRFPVKEELFSNVPKLKEWLKGTASALPFAVNGGAFQKPLLAALISALQGSEAAGYIASDPVADAAETGTIPLDADSFLEEWENTVRTAEKHLPGLRTVMVNTAPYHNAGANAVQELGIAMAGGVVYLDFLIEKGWEPEAALNRFIFHFPTGANFFMETAKFRAARLLWNKIGESYGAGTDSRKMHISAETSWFTKTVLDPYVNMLRAGSEAFAAVLGGVQYLCSAPFNETFENPSPFSERIARNTQLILKEEAGLKLVTDPAGGSWYVETLTNELAQKAWEFFLAIEEAGGLYEALKTGWLQAQIKPVREKRQDDIAARKYSIIGTNVYANLDETAATPSLSASLLPVLPGSLESWLKRIETDKDPLSGLPVREDGQQIPALNQQRLSEPFEQLRLKADSFIGRNGERPSIGLICLGELKRHKARADFIAGFVAPGGIRAVRSGQVNTVEEALNFIESQQTKYFCLCGDNEQYDETGVELAAAIKKALPDIRLYLAGFPREDERAKWDAAGMDGYIHAKSNCLGINAALLKEMEVVSRGEA